MELEDGFRRAVEIDDDDDGRRGIAPPTPEMVEQMKTARGGWTKAQLAEWGVQWPPPKGWRKELAARGTPPARPRVRLRLGRRLHRRQLPGPERKLPPAVEWRWSLRPLAQARRHLEQPAIFERQTLARESEGSGPACPGRLPPAGGHVDPLVVGLRGNVGPRGAIPPGPGALPRSGRHRDPQDEGGRRVHGRPVGDRRLLARRRPPALQLHPRPPAGAGIASGGAPVRPLTLRTFGTRLDAVCEELKGCQVDAARATKRVEGVQNFLLRAAFARPCAPNEQARR